MCGTHLVPGVAHEIIVMNHVALFRACPLRKPCWGTFSLAVNLHFVLAKSHFCRFFGADLHFCWSTHLFRGFALAGDAVGSAESLRVLAKAQQVQVSDVWREELHEIPKRFEDPKGVFFSMCIFGIQLCIRISPGASQASKSLAPQIGWLIHCHQSWIHEHPIS